MINVLYLLNHAGKAGTERYVESLIERMDNNKIKAHFVYNEEGLLADKLKTRGVPTFCLEMKNPFDFKAAIKLAKLCKDLSINLIHTQFLRENYIALLSRLINPKVKVIYTNHFVLKNNFILGITNRLISKLQSNIIAVCNKGKDVLISNGVPKNKITVIFNGVDPSFWGSNEESTLRKEFGIDEDAFVILGVARFAHDKGHKFFIEAIAKLKSKTDRKFKCVLANDGPLLEDCKKLSHDLGLDDSVIFTGFRGDVKNLIYGSDLYVNSSEHEALSFAIIEMLAGGLPVIATDISGNGDIINKETDCGILVKYNDSEGLANAMKTVMEDKDLCEKLKSNAKSAIERLFNLDKNVEQTYKIYLNTLKTEAIK